MTFPPFDSDGPQVGMGDYYATMRNETDPRWVPEIFGVDRVYVEPDGPRTVVIAGKGFGQEPGQVTLGEAAVATTVWTDTSITCDVPAMAGRPKQLVVTTSDGVSATAGVTLHVLDASYNPPIIVVPDATHPTIQSAIDDAADGSLIVVSAGTYYESPIIYKNVKVQGMGARTTIIDGRFFLSYEGEWLAKLATIDFDGAELTPPDSERSGSLPLSITPGFGS